MQASTFVDILSRRAEATPSRTAFEFPSDDGTSAVLTYARLDEKARTLARVLGEHRAAGSGVLLLLPPGEDYIAGFLGCLYAGAVAVPVALPSGARGEAQVLAVAADSGAVVALTDTATRTQLHGRGSALLSVPGLRWIEADGLTGPAGEPAPGRPPAPHAPAFLQYTSGSTGTPKGVVVRHDNLVHNSRIIADAIGAGPESSSVSWLPPYHDMGLIGGILQPLYSGFPSTMLPPTAFLRSPMRWLEAISGRGATLSAAPDFAYLEAVRRTTPEDRLRLDLSRWEHALVGAEPVRASTMEAFARAFAPAGFRPSALHPCYGLAEATLLVTGGTPTGGRPHTVRVSRQDLAKGRATDWTGPVSGPAAVLTSSGRARGEDLVAVVDPGTGLEAGPDRVGEVWVAGPTVADGYWRRPEETERVFRARLAGHGDRDFLRTGDLGFLRDGELYLTGRVKDVMVVRGRNHHPQDVEQTAESAHPGLRPTRGAAFSVDDGDTERVVLVHEVERGFAPAEAAGVVTAVRRAVASEHGIHLHDVALVRPGSIPRTTSGKIRRSACRDLWASEALARVAPAATARDAGPQAGPASGHLAHPGLAALVREVLGDDADRAGADTPLVGLGLDSLRAVHLASALRESFGRDIPVAELLGGMTPADLDRAVSLGPAPVQTPPAAPVAPAVRDRATDRQRNMWLLDRMGAGRAYHVVGGVRLTGPVRPELLRDGLTELVRLHPGLRTVFELGADDVLRTVATPPYAVELPVRDIPASPGRDAGDPRDTVPANAAEAIGELADAPFDLAEGPLLRAVLLRAPGDEWYLGVVAHHIVLDGWSMGLLLGRLGAYYREGRVDGEALPAPAPQPPSALDPAAEAFWRDRLKGAGPVELPLDRPLPPTPSWQGAALPFRLGAAATARLKSAAAARGATPFMALLTGLAAVLTHWTGQDDLVIGTPAAGRHRPGTEQAVGLLVNLVPLRVDASGNPRFGELLDRVRDTCLTAYPHQDHPYEEIQRHAGVDRTGGRAPLVRVSLALQNLPALPWEARGVHAEPFELPSPGSQFELALHVSERPDGSLHGHAVYDTSLFERGSVESLLDTLRLVLDAAPDRMGTAVRELPLVSAAALDRLVHAFGGRDVPALADGLLHTAFEAQAQRAPEATAVVAHDATVSYGELEERANRLAGLLRSMGAGPDARVGVCLPRSPELVVALLAVLKAGAAYVPLDAEHPPGRLAALLADARPGTLLTTGELAARLGEHGARLDEGGGGAGDGAPVVVRLDAAPHPAAGLPASRPPERADGRNLAFVVYTSGTSGTPKAVMTPHAGATNRVEWMQRDFALGRSDAVLHKTSVGFDVSVWEIFWPLSSGARIVLAKPHGQQDPRYLVRLIQEQAVTTCDFVPSMLAVFLDEPGAGGCARPLRRVFSNSEALSPALADRFHELLPSVELFNLYGPTEATIEVVGHPVRPGARPGARLPVGRPIPGARVYVLDARGRPAPVGMPGEVCIGGLPVTRGYWGRPGATAERFVPDPFEPGGRLYRTGDLGRWTVGGTLDFLGRADDQVKIRGHRIEPAEVETALAGHPAVSAVAVVPRPGPDGRLRLVAYTVPAAGEEKQADAAELRSFLSGRLPEAMIPAAFVRLPALPLGPNGKLARRALPDPEPSDASAHAEPATETEHRLAAIWSELLDIPGVSVTDGFFELGGHSLLATRLVARIREDVGVELAVAELLRGGTTIRSLAETVERAQLDQTSPDELERLLRELDGISDEDVTGLLGDDV